MADYYKITHDYGLSDLLPEKKKLEEEYLKKTADYMIMHLVDDSRKRDLLRAYRLYNGNPDYSEYQYLEDNFGLGSSCKINHIPLIKRHIRVIKGMILNTSFEFKATFKNEETLNYIDQEKKSKILAELVDRLQEQIRELSKSSKANFDNFSEKELNYLQNEMFVNVQANIEIVAQELINYFMNSSDFGILKKIETIIEDICISGSFFYRTYIDKVGADPVLEVCNPLNIFYQKNNNNPRLRDAQRVVHRQFMTRSEVLNKLGHLMSSEDKDRIMSDLALTRYGAMNLRERYIDIRDVANTQFSNVQINQHTYNTDEILEVFHCEWVVNNEIQPDEDIEDLIQVEGKKEVKKIKKYRMDRYEVWRIGTDIYAGMGKSKNVIRSQDNPYVCTLSYDGLSLMERNGTPYSLVLATEYLQNLYDVYHFHRDVIIANSGVKGQIVDIGMIPKFLGSTPEERVLKHKMYRKQGDFLLDISQDGLNNLNTIFSGYDDGIDANGLAAINAAIASIEETASTITGVPRQMLGAIEQRDAVSNVKVGINQGLMVTRDLTFMVEEGLKYILTDLLNLSRKAYRKGTKKTYLTNDLNMKIFNVEDPIFPIADMNVFVSNSGKELTALKNLEALTMELVKAQLVEADTAISLIGIESLAKAKEYVKANLEKTSQSKQAIQQLSQQVEELSKQNQELAKNQSNGADPIKQKQLELEERKMMKEFELKERELEVKENNENKKRETEKERNKLEQAQLILGKGPEKEIKNL